MKDNKIYFHIQQHYKEDIVSPFCPNSYKLKELIGTEVFSHDQIHKVLDLGYKVVFIVNVGTLYEKMFNAFCWTLDGTIEYEQPSYSNEKITILMNNPKTITGALQPHIKELKDHLAKLEYGGYAEVQE